MHATMNVFDPLTKGSCSLLPTEMVFRRTKLKPHCAPLPIPSVQDTCIQNPGSVIRLTSHTFFRITFVCVLLGTWSYGFWSYWLRCGFQLRCLTRLRSRAGYARLDLEVRAKKTIIPLIDAI